MGDLKSYGVDSHYEAHDRTFGLLLLIIAATTGSLICIYLYSKSPERPGKYKIDRVSPPTSSVQGVRG